MAETLVVADTRKPRRHQTFYTGHVDDAGDRRFALARIKSGAYQALVTLVLSEVCPMVDYTEEGWAGGRIDADIPLGEEEATMRAIASAVGAEITVREEGQVSADALELRVGKPIADAVIGPRPVVTVPLPKMPE